MMEPPQLGPMAAVELEDSIKGLQDKQINDSKN